MHSSDNLRVFCLHEAIFFFFLPALASNQLLSAVLFAFVNLRGGAWRQKLASSAGAPKLEAMSGSTVLTGRWLIG